MQDEKQLKDYVSRCKDGGVKQVLVIGGGREPMGKFDSSFQLLLDHFVSNCMVLFDLIDQQK